MDLLVSVIVYGVATYGIATVITDYDGPFGVFDSLRQKFALFRCSVCLSTWLIVVFWLVGGLAIIESLAALGIAVFILRNEL